MSKQITHLISEVDPESEEGGSMGTDWELVMPVETRSRFVLDWSVMRGGWPWKHEHKLWIYERRWLQV